MSNRTGQQPPPTPPHPLFSQVLGTIYTKVGLPVALLMASFTTRVALPALSKCFLLAAALVAMAQILYWGLHRPIAKRRINTAVAGLLVAAALVYVAWSLFYRLVRGIRG